MRRCHTCRYWTETKPKEGVGECRRSAPQLVVRVQSDGSAIESRVCSEWPTTLDCEWCGEHSDDPETAMESKFGDCNPVVILADANTKWCHGLLRKFIEMTQGEIP